MPTYCHPLEARRLFAADGEIDHLFGDEGTDSATVDNDDILNSMEIA